MRKFIIKETYRFKSLKRGSVEQRVDNMNHSLELIEKEYQDRYGNSGISFENWLSGGAGGLRDTDYRRKYINALNLPIDGYKRVHEFNKCQDSYYQSKLDAGLIVPMTEKEMKKRSYSPTLSTSEEGDEKQHYILQGKEKIGFDTWMDSMTTKRHYDRGGQVAKKVLMHEGTPETIFFAKEEQLEARGTLTTLFSKKFKPQEVEVLIAYYERIDEGRGMQMELYREMAITRGKFENLIKRADKFLAELGQSA